MILRRNTQTKTQGFGGSKPAGVAGDARGFDAVGGFGAEPAGGLVAAGAADAVGVLSSMV